MSTLRVRLAAAVLVGVCRLLTGVRALWRDSEPVAGARIYFANHSSHLDGLVIWSALSPALREHTRPVAARDYWEASRLRRWLASEVFGAILIERHGESGAHGAPLAPLLAALDRGDALILFPEGTRGDGTLIQPFKSGLYHLARHRPGLELVPVYLENLNRVLPKGSVLPVPLLCAARFGAPLRLHEGETKVDLLARAKAAVEGLAR
jgi:1-acyl-sn-glycerol-3-phosphate acyltransferase